MQVHGTGHHFHADEELGMHILTSSRPLSDLRDTPDMFWDESHANMMQRAFQAYMSGQAQQAA